MQTAELKLKERAEERGDILEMLEDEVDDEGDVEALVVGWDYDTVLVLLLIRLFTLLDLRHGSS